MILLFFNLLISCLLNVLDGLGALPLFVACCNSFENVVDRSLSVYLVSRCVGPFRLFQDVWSCAELSWADADLQFVFGCLN